LLQDLCVLLGAKLVSSSTGLALEKTTMAELGQAQKFVTDAKTTTLVGTGATKEAVQKHVQDLQAQLEDVTLDTEHKMKLQVRIAGLATGVAVIKVGGSTEIEITEKK